MLSDDMPTTVLSKSPTSLVLPISTTTCLTVTPDPASKTSLTSEVPVVLFSDISRSSSYVSPSVTDILQYPTAKSKDSKKAKVTIPKAITGNAFQALMINTQKQKEQAENAKFLRKLEREKKKKEKEEEKVKKKRDREKKKRENERKKKEKW